MYITMVFLSVHRPAAEDTLRHTPPTHQVRAGDWKRGKRSGRERESGADEVWRRHGANEE